jgi:alkanesulfonate monooxygenase SsuD/methylene tetrahydromethanopterin reductase-like flavin-dependent oxidoreductase (luciferase family)
MIANDLVLVGSPSSVAGQVERLCAAGSVDTFLGMFTFGTMPREAALANLRLFAEQVVPAMGGDAVERSALPRG